MDFKYRFSYHIIWNSFHETNQSIFNLQENKKSESSSILLGHTKLESTVRYLGVEVDDALELSEAKDI